MKFGNKIVVAVDLNENLGENLKKLKNLDLIKHGEIHFTHVFPTIVYSVGISEYSMTFPVQDDRSTIEKSVLATLADHTKDISPKMIHTCLFDESPKKRLCKYAQDIHADTIIVMTKEKHGIFESSVAQYLARHSSCHVLILKP